MGKWKPASLQKFLASAIDIVSVVE